MIDWTAATADFRFGSREGDRVRVKAPDNSMARDYNGQDGHVAGFWPQWVLVRLDETGEQIRLRPDELVAL